ncbi:MAG: transposase [Bacillota bacterium]
MDELSQRDDVCLFALDETGIRLESSNFYGWAPKGLPLYAEANGDHKGVNVIGATEILKTFKPYYSIYSSREGIKAPHVGRFIDKLMRRNPDKEVWMIMDNYPPHRSIASEYERKYQGRLHFIFLPPYSPELNPEENMWAWPWDYCARESAYAVDKELPQRIRKFFEYAYNTPSKVRRRVDARSYFKAS